MNTNYYQTPTYGYGYGAPRPQARNTQPLTPDQIQKLRQDSNAFNMKVDVEDLWRAVCTHKEKTTGASTLVQNNDGSYTCTICHETFNMCDSSEEEIQKAVDTIIDMLQTCKTIYLDAPEDLISQYMQQIALIKKFPGLWKRAIQNFSMYENTLNGVNQIGAGFSGFNAMQNLLTNPYTGYAQPQYNPYQNPQMPMQPPYMNTPQMMGMPPVAPAVDPMSNPMAYGAPTAVPTAAPMAPAPAPAPGVMPAAPAPAPATAAPAAAPANGEVQQQQVFNV